MQSADIMSVVVRAVYHKNGVDSTTTAYIIGIYIKNGVGDNVVYVNFECVGPIVPWFAVRIIMVEMLLGVLDLFATHVGRVV